MNFNQINRRSSNFTIIIRSLSWVLGIAFTFPNHRLRRPVDCFYVLITRKKYRQKHRYFDLLRTNVARWGKHSIVIWSNSVMGAAENPLEISEIVVRLREVNTIAAQVLATQLSADIQVRTARAPCCFVFHSDWRRSFALRFQLGGK